MPRGTGPVKPSPPHSVGVALSHARVAELEDAPGLGPGARKGLGVRVPPLAPPLTCRSLYWRLHRDLAEMPSCSRLLTELLTGVAPGMLSDALERTDAVRPATSRSPGHISRCPASKDWLSERPKDPGQGTRHGEIAAFLGITRQRAVQISAMDGFPPVEETAGRPMWRTEAIEAWAEANWWSTKRWRVRPEPEPC